jgi:hypothetical protein
MIDVYIFHKEESPWKIIAKRYDKFSVSIRVSIKLSKLTQIVFAEYGSKVAKYVRQSNDTYIP